MRILGLLHHITVKVVDLDILACDGVSNSSSVFALALARVHVRFYLAVVLAVCQLRFDSSISLFLVSVQVLHELLNIGNAVLARVVLPRRNNMLLGLHIGSMLPSGRLGS